MHLDTDTKLEIFVDGDSIVLKKHRPAGSCDFCGEVDDNAIQYAGYCLSLIHISTTASAPRSGWRHCTPNSAPTVSCPTTTAAAATCPRRRSSSVWLQASPTSSARSCLLYTSRCV